VESRPISLRGEKNASSTEDDDSKDCPFLSLDFLIGAVIESFCKFYLLSSLE